MELIEFKTFEQLKPIILTVMRQITRNCPDADKDIKRIHDIVSARGFDKEFSVYTESKEFFNAIISAVKGEVD